MKNVFLAIMITLISAFNLSAAELKDGKVEFTAIGNPGFLKIKGEGGIAKGSWEIKDGLGSGKFDCELALFVTGIDARDEHMRDKYLEVSKFPKAFLVIEPAKISEEFDWQGKLTIKGITKPVKGKAIIKGGEVTAEFSVSIKDYPKIGIPKHLGVTVAEMVDVKVTGKL